MKLYVAFDDTDTLDCGRGTGKIARWFERELPEKCRVWGIVRQQLLVDESIPYTSHNSALCVVLDAPDDTVVTALIERAVQHIQKHFIEGSDPGICVASGGNGSLAGLMEFGKRCTLRKVTQQDALKSAAAVHLSGHGGTNDGIIGAAAAVGLTALGESGRLIELNGNQRLRDFSAQTTAAELRQHGIQPVSIDRDAKWILDDDLIDNGGWLRPRLWFGNIILPVMPHEQPGCWKTLAGRRRHYHQQNI